MTTKRYRVTGMSCAACSAAVEKAAKKTDGIADAAVSLLGAEMNITYAENADLAACETRLLEAVTSAGYPAHPYDVRDEAADIDRAQRDETKALSRRLIPSVILLLLLMYVSMGAMLGLPQPSFLSPVVTAVLQLVLSGAVLFINRSFFVKGIKTLLRGAPGMDTLIAFGSGISYGYSVYAAARIVIGAATGNGDIVDTYAAQLYFESAAMILTLITFGKWLESIAKGKTNDSVKALIALSPQTATVLAQDGTESKVEASALNIGDVVRVRTGEKVPCDGTVLDGTGEFDQSAVTGESVTVPKKSGDSVICATVCTDGYVDLRAEKVGADTTLSQMVRLVREASATKAPIARLADRVSGIFAPVVLGISVLVLIIWLIDGMEVAEALNFAISVIVVSCPCALGLATPVAILCGTGRAAQLGILFRNAAVLERAHAVDTIVFDKTGTLTEGKPSVTEIFPMPDVSKEMLISYAAALETPSDHPYADAIRRYAATQKNLPDPPQITQFDTRVGLGIAARTDRGTLFAGNRRMALGFVQSMITPAVDAVEKRCLDNGRTPVFFGQGNRLLGIIAFADLVRPTAKDAIEELHDGGKHTVLLSGDNSTIAQSVAHQLGVDEVHADVLPAGKQQEIETQQQSGKTVMMVGDGINDAPALTAADIGIAVGDGTDIAMQSADIVLMKNDPMDVCTAISLSGATVRNIKINLFWAFFYNVLMIPVAAGALYPAFGIAFEPMYAAGAMSISSLFVVLNALRLRRFSPPKE